MNTLQKVEYILRYSVFDTKQLLADELDISRPTLNAKMNGEQRWKKLEILWVDNLYNKLTKNQLKLNL